MHRAAAAPSPMGTLHRMVLALLAGALLLTGFAGRAGVQVIDRDTAAKLFAVHLHGVPGEAAYVATYGEPAPFVHPHCHRQLQDSAARPTPDEVQAASSLAGNALCSAEVFALPLPAPSLAGVADSVAIPSAIQLPPASPPPQVYRFAG